MSTGQFVPIFCDKILRPNAPAVWEIHASPAILEPPGDVRREGHFGTRRGWAGEQAALDRGLKTIAWGDHGDPPVQQARQHRNNPLAHQRGFDSTSRNGIAIREPTGKAHEFRAIKCFWRIQNAVQLHRLAGGSCVLKCLRQFEIAVGS